MATCSDLCLVVFERLLKSGFMSATWHGDDEAARHAQVLNTLTQVQFVRAAPAPTVRVLAPGNRVDDPYVIGHADPVCLADDELDRRHVEWCQSARVHLDLSLGVEETFEAFLDWLTERHGYYQLIVADATKVFE